METIEAHLIPRALHRDCADGESNALELSSMQGGFRYNGKGLWDGNLLCAEHESALQDVDDYGIDVCRRFQIEGTVSEDGTTYLVNNPNPRLFVRFIAACIWRRDRSLVRKPATPQRLGIYELPLRNFVFGWPTRYEPGLLVIRRRLMSESELLPAPIMMMPAADRKWGHRAWSFQHGDLYTVLFLATHHHSAVKWMHRFVNHDPVLSALNAEPTEFTNDRDLFAMVVNFSKPRGRY